MARAFDYERRNFPWFCFSHIENFDFHAMNRRRRNRRGMIPFPNPELVYNLITQLNDTNTRKNALIELIKIRHSVPDLAPMLWHSFGTVSSLMKEIINIYPVILSQFLTVEQSFTICHVLAIFESFAAHPETRGHFLAAEIPLYIYPFMSVNSEAEPYEFLRLASLGVIAAAVKPREKEVINYFLQTELIPICLKIMELNSDLCKIVATYIMESILLDQNGLSHTCGTYERFSHVARTLGMMVLNIANKPLDPSWPTVNLLRHIIRCFLQLAENPRACEALRSCIPEPVMDGKLFFYIREGDPCRSLLLALTNKLRGDII